MSKKQVMMIMPGFPPYAGSGVHRNLRFVKHLVSLEWHVTVLSLREDCIRKSLPCDPNLLGIIPERVRLERTHATRLLETLLRLRGKISLANKGKEKASGLHTQERGPLPKQSRVFQGLKDLISTVLRFPDAEIGWVPWAILRGLKVCKQRGISVLYTSGPPHSCHLIGLALQSLTGLPWVVDFRDPWTRQAWIPKAAKETCSHRLKVALESRVVRSASRVILNTNEMRDDFASFYPRLASGKFTAIYNGFDPESIPEIPSEPGDKKLFTVTYTGSFYKQRTPICFLRALGELIGEGKIERSQIHVRLIGRCEVDGVHEEVNRLGLQPCVELIQWLRHEESLKAIAVSDLLLLIQPGTRLQIPGKIFEYMMLKKRMLALTDDGATSSIMKSYDLGSVAKPRDIPSIKKALLKFYEERLNPEPLSQRYLHALETFNAKALTKQLEQVFREVTAGTGE